MALQINLISKKIAGIAAKERLQWIIRLGSIIAMAVFIVVSVLVLSYFYFLKRRTDVLDSQISQAEIQVTSLQGKETKLVYLDKKLTTLAPILELQIARQKQVEALFSLIPEGVSISGFDLLGEEGIKLTGNALEFSSLEELFNNITERTEGVSGGLVVTSAYVEGVDQEGEEAEQKEGYSFQITIKFNETGSRS